MGFKGDTDGLNKSHPAVRCCGSSCSAWTFNAGLAAKAVRKPWVMATARRKQLMQRVSPQGSQEHVGWAEPSRGSALQCVGPRKSLSSQDWQGVAKRGHVALSVLEWSRPWQGCCKFHREK